MRWIKSVYDSKEARNKSTTGRDKTKEMIHLGDSTDRAEDEDMILCLLQILLVAGRTDREAERIQPRPKRWAARTLQRACSAHRVGPKASTPKG